MVNFDFQKKVVEAALVVFSQEIYELLDGLSNKFKVYCLGNVLVADISDKEKVEKIGDLLDQIYEIIGED